MNMRQTMMMAIAAGMILAAGSAVNLRGQSGTAQPQPVAVAVVDVEKVFNESDERSEIEANIQGRIAELQKLEQQKRQHIQNLRSDLDIMDPTSDNYDKKRNELRQALIALRVHLEVAQREIEQEKALQLEAIYRKIIHVVENIAQAEGYDLVLFRDHMPDITNASQQQIAGLIQVRKVLYSADKLDLTERVKQRLNSHYKS
jgi:Skp family chaperone for outer membrane proteins